MLKPRLIKHPFLYSCGLFVLLWLYFFFSYSYFPGLSLAFQGTLSGDVSGRLYWDFGDGFNEHDFVRLELSHDQTIQNIDPVDIVIEGAGLKDPKSHGYLTWLVIRQKDYDNKTFSIQGKHHWGHWVTIKHKQQGRQLALFPGSKIILTDVDPLLPVYFFKTPQSGIARISSNDGPVKYYNCYALNPGWEISKYSYHGSSTGKIGFINVEGWKTRQQEFTLPRYKIKSLKFIPEKGSLLIPPTPGKELLIRPHKTDSKEKSVRIQSILVNGKSVGLQDDNIIFQGRESEGKITLESSEDFVRVIGEIFSYEIVFEENNSLDAMETILDGKTIDSRHLESQNGSTALYGECPAVSGSFQLTGISLTDSQGGVHSLTNGQQPDGTYVWRQLDTFTQGRFHSLLFLVQGFTAAVSALVFYSFLCSPMFFQCTMWRDVPKALFLENGRWLFWTIFLIGVSINCLWLLAEWPGSLTPDAIQVNKEIKMMNVSNHHPYTYIFFVLGLYNFFDSPLIVILFQIVSFHLLIASFMYLIYRNGVRWYFILSLSFLTFLSIPINLFNITMWKDIPYSTLVLFWAFFLTWLYMQKRREGCFVQPDNRYLILLVLAFIGLCTFRHNGIVYAVFIPVSLLFFSSIRKIWVVKFCVLSLTMLLLTLFVFPDYVLQQDETKNNYSTERSKTMVKRAARIAESGADYYLEDYLADRTRMFFATLGTSVVASSWYNDMHNSPQRWLSVDQLRAESLVAPKSEILVRYKDNLLKTRTYQGYTRGKFIFWNSLFGFLFLCLAFLLYKWIPVSAFYSSFFLFQAVAMFFVVWPRWRYLYFLYLGGIYLIFIVLLEYSERNRTRQSINTESI